MSTARSPPRRRRCGRVTESGSRAGDLPEVPSAAPDRVRSGRIESGREVTLYLPALSSSDLCGLSGHIGVAIGDSQRRAFI
jgi:hypothetical protein